MQHRLASTDDIRTKRSACGFEFFRLLQCHALDQGWRLHEAVTDLRLWMIRRALRLLIRRRFFLLNGLLSVTELLDRLSLYSTILLDLGAFKPILIIFGNYRCVLLTTCTEARLRTWSQLLDLLLRFTIDLDDLSILFGH